ncbi:MAG: nucleotidyltransferase domain-containing protein [Thaumarchaeota archaeon]|nr:nucleotidyltransferase domain-containing protein [Nitrososphaerota archaeon]MDE1841579.1 nucleotidyltransferase domain-containing protein [Nitrososphaerota archaeon]MDE1877491.1 nucleotidyltransferase domain-containing protein [Nitrososphaerota archaeon]
MLEEYNINQTTLKILGLYLDDYKKSLHLREISRETKTDVKAIQLQLKKLEKINVLSSIIRGRNKDYQLNLNNVTAKYYLVMAETFMSIIYLKRHFLIKKIVEEIENKVHDPLILFGSFAKETYTKDSDVDVFLISDKKINTDSIIEATNMVGRKINLKSTSRQQFLEGLRNNDPLVKEIVSNHVVLKGADQFSDIMWCYHAS